MLEWILWATGLLLTLAGIAVALRLREPYAQGLVALGNVALLGYNLLGGSIGFAAYHFTLAVGCLGLWFFLAGREDA